MKTRTTLKTLTLLLAALTYLMTPSILDAHVTDPSRPDGHGYVKIASGDGNFGEHHPNVVAYAVVHDMVWQGQEAFAVHYTYIRNDEQHAINYGYRFDFKVHWLWKRTETVRATLFSTDPFEVTQGTLDPGDPPLEISNFHNSYDISPHKFEAGEKFAADA